MTSDKDTTEVDRSRRRYYAISPRTIVLWLADGGAWEVVDGVPKDVEYVYAGYNEHRDEFYVVLRHDSFEPRKEGERIPEGTIEIEDITEEVNDETE